MVDGVVQEEEPALSEHDTKWLFSIRVGGNDEEPVVVYLSCRVIKQLSSVSPKLSLNH